MPEKTSSSNDIVASPDRDWAELVGKAIDDFTRIVQSEIRLLETTLKVVLQSEIDHALAILIAGAMMMCGALCLIGASILLLHQWLPWWAAFGISGTGLFVVAGLIRAIASERRQAEALEK